MQPHHWIIVLNLLLIFLLKLSCFAFGFFTVKIGAELLREGVKGEFTFDTDLSGPKALLRSASPGLLFLALGIALIAYAMSVDKVISYDAARTATASAPDVPMPDAAELIHESERK